MSNWLHFLLVFAGVAAINGLVWALVLPPLRRRGREQLRRYGTVDTHLAEAPPIDSLSWVSYVGTRVDNQRYFAPGWWVRFTGRAALTAEAFVLFTPSGRAAVIVPRRAVTGIERRQRFAGRGRLGRVITVVSWSFGGGVFQTGVILGHKESQRQRWERALSTKV